MSAHPHLLAISLAIPGVALAQEQPNAFAERLAAAALAQTASRVTYDGSYRRIAYPGGDVPESVGVCTDVVIRAYRRLGIDLQVEVHEDMVRAFTAYPQVWGMSGPDTNIDHRRLPNLQVFLRRRGAALPVSREADAYRAGDLVTWMLPHDIPHIGVVTAQKSAPGTPLVVHNIGRGPELEDVLFTYTITGHYRYHPSLAGPPRTKASELTNGGTGEVWRWTLRGRSESKAF